MFVIGWRTNNEQAAKSIHVELIQVGNKKLRGTDRAAEAMEGRVERRVSVSSPTS